MSREFEVTEGMVESAVAAAADASDARLARCSVQQASIAAALAHPDFRAQLRAWAAEEMRGLVAKKTTPDSYHSNERARARVWNACRAETLANIEKWANLEDAP